MVPIRPREHEFQRKIKMFEAYTYKEERDEALKINR